MTIVADNGTIYNSSRLVLRRFWSSLFVVAMYLVVVGNTQATMHSLSTVDNPLDGARVAIVGASLGGLSAAVTMHQLGAAVSVFERSAGPLNDKGSGLGFVDVRLWEVLTGKRMMRRGVRAHREQGAFYYGDLWTFLAESLPDGTVQYGSLVTSLGDDTQSPTIMGRAYDLVILSDGGFSGLRRYVTNTTPEYAGYSVWRGLIASKYVPHFGAFGVWKSPDYLDTIAMPLAKDRDGDDFIVCGVFIEQPEEEVEYLKPRSGDARQVVTQSKKAVPQWWLQLYKQEFGHQAGGELVRLMEAVLQSGTLTCHPQYEHAAARVVRGRLVLVGDAAHMASPRTAAGAHTAVLDALALREAFVTADEQNGKEECQTVGARVEAALRRYAPLAVERAQALYSRSRQLRRQFVRGSSPRSPASRLVSIDS